MSIDPQDIQQMAAAMERVLTDGQLKESLRQAGLKRSKEFSIEKTARQTLAVYQKVHA